MRNVFDNRATFAPTLLCNSFLDDLTDSGATSDLLNAVTDYSNGNSDSYALTPIGTAPLSSGNTSTLAILGVIVLAIIGFVLFEKR